MINLDFHANKLLEGLALGRFNVHVEEIKRVLQPVLVEVHKFGYDQGIADQINNTVMKPVGVANATVDIKHIEETEPVVEVSP